MLIFLLFIITFYTSTFRLGLVPYGLNVDEAGMSYDAFCLSKYGVDRYLNHLPVYLINYGGGQSALYAYLIAILIKVFGYSTIIARIPAVIFRLLIFISIVFIFKDEKDKLKTFIFLFLLSIVPYFIMQSRWGLDCNLLVGALTISICFFVQSIKHNNNKLLLFVSGIFFGLSLYTYALSYIIIPILLLSICIYLLYIKKINIKELIIFWIPIIIFALPLFLMILVNSGYIEEIKGFITIPLLKRYRGSEISLRHIFENFYILQSILSFDKEDILIYNSIPYFGTIYYFTIPFTILGFVKCLKDFSHSIKNKEFNINIVFVLWFFSVFICQLLIKSPDINKANGIFVPLIYFSAIGIETIVINSKAFIFPIFLILIINFTLFFNYYFYHYNIDTSTQFYFATYYLNALDYSRSLKRENVYIDNNLAAEEYIYVLLDNFVSPYEYRRSNIKTTYDNVNITYNFGISKNINSNDAYIIRGDNVDLIIKFRKLGFTYQKFGYFKVFYHCNT